LKIISIGDSLQMKSSKKSNEGKILSFSPSKNFKFYGMIASIGSGMAALFFLGFWLMSLLDRSKETPVIATPIISQPTSITRSPDSSISQSPISSASTSIPTIPIIPVLPINSIDNKIKDFTYKVVSQTNFKYSSKLQRVVDRIVNYSKVNDLPLSALSITLIDTKTGEKAEYQGKVERYPASVVKMFWLTAIYQKISMGEADESQLKGSIEQMIYKSDNQGAGQVIDAVTNTKSTIEKLSERELQIRKQQRQSLNNFFRQAGYSTDMNVSQKTFPIPQENMMEPKGFDKQLRGEDPQKPIRNRITTDDASRLMYEVVNAQAVNPEVSSKMRKLLTRNIDPTFWKKQPPNPVDFNPVESFFGEGLPENKTENIVSKAGWTASSRQEVAFVKSKDGNTRYILAVFGDNIAYGKSKKVFPGISKLVYEQMRKDLIKH
jgi:Beta-lactamase enzyme family